MSVCPKCLELKDEYEFTVERNLELGNKHLATGNWMLASRYYRSALTVLEFKGGCPSCTEFVRSTRDKFMGG